MDEIVFEKSIKATKHLIKHLDVEKFLDYPDAENYIEYRYAKNYIEYQNITWFTPAQTRAIEYRTAPDSGEKYMLPDLMSESKKTKVAWDALNLIAQDLLREGKRLPPALAEWVRDVLADQLVKKGPKQRPRPARGTNQMENRDAILRPVIGHLKCLFALRATRNAGAPPMSACDVVAAVMEMPYKTVEKIWNQRSSHEKAFLSALDKQALMKSPFLSSRNS